MDLASLQNEVKHNDLPPLIEGWSNDDFFTLLKMYEDKCSLETLAVHFNKTRGQISGLIHRAKRKGLVKGIRALQIVKPVVIKEAKPRPTIEPFNVASFMKRLAKASKVKKSKRLRLRMIEDTNQVTFAELEPHHCRWPIGDPRQSDFRFCGCRRELGKPYCMGHVAKAGRLYDQKAQK